MKRTVALSMLIGAIAGVIALAPAYLKRGSVSATSTAKVDIFEPFTVTNGQLPLQNFLDSVGPAGTDLRGTARLNVINADAALTILNRTNLCPTPSSVSFVVKIIDNETGAILGSGSGGIPPGGQYHLDSVRGMISAGAFDANGVITARLETQIFPPSDFVLLSPFRRVIGVNLITGQPLIEAVGMRSFGEPDASPPEI